MSLVFLSTTSRSLYNFCYLIIISHMESHIQLHKHILEKSTVCNVTLYFREILWNPKIKIQIHPFFILLVFTPFCLSLLWYMDHPSHHWFPNWTFITPPLLLLQPTPSFLHPEYNARIRGISNSMSFRSEHHRSYSFSGLSPSRSSISPSVLHSLLFSFYISVILFCILPGSFLFFWSEIIKRSIAGCMQENIINL